MGALFEDPDFRSGQLLGDIWQERSRQQELWGEQNHDDGKWMIILMEEIGEAAKDLFENRDKEADVELIQCAAVILSWLEARGRRSAR